MSDEPNSNTGLSTGLNTVGETSMIRPLGHLETFKSSLHLLRQHCGTAVSCRYSLPESLQFEAAQDALLRAVAQTVMDHPIMQAGLGNEDSSRPHWIRLDTIHLENHITWHTVQESDVCHDCLEQAIATQIHTWFTDLETKPGWRVHVLRQENTKQLTVIFCWNHAFFDGMSAKIFHQTLLKHLNSGTARQDLPFLKDSVIHLQDPSTNFPPPTEALRTIQVTLWFTLKTVWRELFPAFLVPSNPFDAHWAPVKTDPYNTNSRLIRVSDEDLRKILSACRKHETTLTGILNVLPLFSLAEQLEGKVQALSSVMAIDIRRFMPCRPEAFPWYDPHSSMENKVSLVDDDFDADLLTAVQTACKSAASKDAAMTQLEETMWRLAARTRQKLQEKLDSDLYNDPSGLMAYVADWRAQMKSKTTKPRARSWGVTNLGTFADAEPGWKIDDAVFKLSAEVNASVFHISVVSVRGGDLCVDVGWQEGIIDPKIGDRLAADMESWLRYLARA
ncbi:alcohol acetyltransferase [Stachybotrys elegans]|uniref:Alcohol acetyltransferase n=1 Tax=Stachybotrys elegans TaxID=80388 RepID=A0A8K0WV10_9HYPO|nr:alcohol acetyltransferase [Stachybotrys elegans]